MCYKNKNNCLFNLYKTFYYLFAHRRVITEIIGNRIGGASRIGIGKTANISSNLIQIAALNI